MKSHWKFCLGFMIALASVAAPTSWAAQPSITKITVEMILPNITGDLLPAKPKTIYRAGNKYARMEEKRDSLGGDQTLIITNEPDSWVINLSDKTGRHQVDAGPKFDTHAPIFWTTSGQPEPEFVELEFANELKFFDKDRALELKPRKVDGKKCKAFSIKTGPHEAILLLNPKNGKPLQIELMKFGRLVATAKYLGYETGLPFKASYFQPPAGIKLTEAE